MLIKRLLYIILYISHRRGYLIGQTGHLPAEAVYLLLQLPNPAVIVKQNHQEQYYARSQSHTPPFPMGLGLLLP